MTTLEDGDDERRAEQLVAQAAIDYVDYFFPKDETGEDLAWTSGGELIRAVRLLKHVRATSEKGREG